MNVKTFKEKSEAVRKAKQIFKEELDEWYVRIAEIMTFLNSNNCSLQYDGEKYMYSKYLVLVASTEKYGLTVSDDDDKVTIGRYTSDSIGRSYINERNYLGVCILSLEDFIADDWKDRLSKVISKGKSLEEEIEQKELEIVKLRQELTKIKY